MRDLLIYMPSNEDAAEIRRLFAEPDYRTTFVDSIERAAEYAAQGFFDLAIIWPAQFATARELIDFLQESGQTYLPVVAVVRELSETPRLRELALAEILELPIPREEFFRIIEDIGRDVQLDAVVSEGMNWEGSLGEYNLIDLVQMLESGGRDADLTVRFRDDSGHVYFRQGKVINAELGSLGGLDALRKMSFWPAGRFQTRLTSVETVAAAIPTESREVLMTLVEDLLNREVILEGLPEISEEIIKDPFVPQKTDISPLQKRILAACESPLPLIKLLNQLPEGNEEICEQLRALFAGGQITLRRKIEARLRAEKPQGGFMRLLGSLSAIFRKESAGGSEEPVYIFEDDGIPAGRLEIRPPLLEKSDRELIRRKIEGVGKL